MILGRAPGGTEKHDCSLAVEAAVPIPALHFTQNAEFLTRVLDSYVLHSALDVALNESMPQSRRRSSLKEPQCNQEDAECDEGTAHKAADGLPVTEEDTKAEVLPAPSP